MDEAEILGGVKTSKIVTAVVAEVPEDKEAEFLDGYRALLASEKADGLLRSELLRRTDGGYVIQTVWRDHDALTAARKKNTPPAALALLDEVGAKHFHNVFTIEAEYTR